MARRSTRPRRPTYRVLITAGPTREYLDPVRYLSNDSSGQMGWALAQAAVRRGHAVTLVHGPVAMAPPNGVAARPVISADEMGRVCRACWPAHDVLIMAAAVADYTPTRPRQHKRKKSSDMLTLALKPTPDILKRLAHGRRTDQVVIGFALEDRAPRRGAGRKLEEKRLDAIVLNQPGAIGARESTVEILTRGEGWSSAFAGSKRRHATRIVRLAEGLAAQKKAAGPVTR